MAENDEPEIPVPINLLEVPPLPPPQPEVSLSDLTPIAPPLFLPKTPLLSSIQFSESWVLTSNDSKRCQLVEGNDKKETKRLHALQIPILAQEVVIYICPKNQPLDTFLQLSDPNLKVTRVSRAALLTSGSIQLKKLPLYKTHILRAAADRNNPNIKFDIFQLRGVHMHRDVVLLVYDDSYNHHDAKVNNKAQKREQNLENCYAIYQTPEPHRFLQPMALTALAAYVGVPNWAVPICWSGNLPTLPRVSPQDYKTWLGQDAGFSSAMYAAVVAYLVQHKIINRAVKGGAKSIARIISKQQPPTSLPIKQHRVLDLLALTQQLAGEQKGMVDPMVVNGLHALAFNLVFRKLSLKSYQTPSSGDSGKKANFQQALSKALLYNVTLRDVDFSHTNLQGLGEGMGKAWAMNAQPLIARVNFSYCQLTNRDLRGLLIGLSRIWCGGTAFLESIQLAGNPDIPTSTFDFFFKTLKNPRTLPFWPKTPPPPPNLSFLQELNLLDTKAVGPGLIEVAAKLSGLRTLKISSNQQGSADVLVALWTAGAPLQSFRGKNLSDSCTHALFGFCDTLKTVVFDGFVGDTTPLLCSWPKPVPGLHVKFLGKLNTASCNTPDGNGNSPGELSIDNIASFGMKVATTVLPVQSTRLKKLSLFKMHYSTLTEAAPMLAVCGLETLHIWPKPHNFRGTASEAFWTALASSKTLRDLQLPDQVGTAGEIAMIGRFLKANRSVERIGFDSPSIILDVESVTVLRAAFYGNQKVIDMQYPQKARKKTMDFIKKETYEATAEVTDCKASIKRLFKRHYSKYNSSWREKPNELKLPYVERIRMAKRKIGQLKRDSAKIGKLLDEINSCIQQNKRNQASIQHEKAMIKLSGRERQLKQLAAKKTKFLTNLVTKLHKAKKRARERKSAKTQVPRSLYYRSRDIWPSTSDPRRHRSVHSDYRYYNDPYDARYHWCYGYYGYHYDLVRDGYLQDDSAAAAATAAAVAIDAVEPGLDEALPDVGTDAEGGDRGDVAAGKDLADPETSVLWNDMLADVEGISSETADPWERLDSLIEQVDGTSAFALTPEYLSEVHVEASELGADVISDISRTLDDGAAVDAKINEISEQTNAGADMVQSVMVDSSPETVFDLGVLQSTLDDLPDYDQTMAAEADDAVGMYAGAGPRDLDDGGPSPGGFGHAALAGARSRARARKEYQTQTRVRGYASRRLHAGYKNLLFHDSTRQMACSGGESVWPSNIFESWREGTQMQQIQAMAESDVFNLPEVSEHTPRTIAQWSRASAGAHEDIIVVLVTQCSLDRLSNLEKQLASWAGCASVAVYIKSGENSKDAEKAISECVQRAKDSARGHYFDVALTLVNGYLEDEPYPINYLRNVALLEARNQHLRFHASLENSAALLVDVDFRPSANLHAVLHSENAATAILHHRRVVVCPAFESTNDNFSKTINDLKTRVEIGEAEGFHLSHFPQGHSPTKFDKFWNESLELDEQDENEPWKRSYKVQYEKLFEPYVVMASRDVPLYDERFQGYGLNKVSHLSSVAKQNRNEFWVLPGVFLVAPAHRRSESWSKRYGSVQSDETKFNQLWLKGLYYNFLAGLEKNEAPVVSNRTRLQHCVQLVQDRESVRMDNNNLAKDALPLIRRQNFSAIIVSTGHPRA